MPHTLAGEYNPVNSGPVGHGNATVTNGEEGLAAHDAEKPDLIILDLMMPVMDGFTVLQKLKERKSSVPVFVLSSLGQNADIATVRELGAVDFLVKSDVQLEEIITKVRATIGK